MRRSRARRELTPAVMHRATTKATASGSGVATTPLVTTSDPPTRRAMTSRSSRCSRPMALFRFPPPKEGDDRCGDDSSDGEGESEGEGHGLATMTKITTTTMIATKQAAHTTTSHAAKTREVKHDDRSFSLVAAGYWLYPS